VLTLNLASVAATSSRAQILCAAPSRQPREHLLLRVKRSLITRNWPEFQIHTHTHIVVVVVVVVARAAVLPVILLSVSLFVDALSLRDVCMRYMRPAVQRVEFGC
jgi:hypothetical protein